MTFTPPDQPGTRYRVYMTPLESKLVYADEIEVSDHIQQSGINQIKRGIDSQDYNIGVYFYSDLELIGNNELGYFNDSNDERSIFRYLRDRTKVRVVFENIEGDSIVYRGLISEEATKINSENGTIIFRVLSRDSVIRNTKIPGGTVNDGDTVKTAIVNILANTVITSVLDINESNIDPTVNFQIDLGGAFDDQPTQEMLNQLLLASNSVMKIDEDGIVYVTNRTENMDTDILNLYGPYDIQRRQNVINFSGYNTGLHRTFTSVAVTDADGTLFVADNTDMANTYGYRQTSMEFSFLNNPTTVATIANSLVDQFSVPKIELEVEVPTSVAHSVEVLDRVSLSWPLRITPYTETGFMPVVGVATIDNATYPLPRVSGIISIGPDVAFKILEIDEDPNTFTSILKLRQSGTTVSDGYYSIPSSSIVGYAVVGEALVGA